ncbi:MAG: radical SAM protein [Acidobacteriota bacterium]|jgi:wyosine [tRNA(Phe)-imidazoG37] synthetase (radical SAM superfamily)|nr:radical SAM protein [Acidobacteriota bacterium]
MEGAGKTMRSEGVPGGRPENPGEGLREAWRRHERRWRGHRFVYAVVSRRSRGVSVGVNLSPGKACNFGCAYCQVKRPAPPAQAMPGREAQVDEVVLAQELDGILQAERDGSLYGEPPFDALPAAGRGVRDIAFSGDGEPTAYPGFGRVVDIAAAARARHGLSDAKLVLITNAAYLGEPAVRDALEVLDANNGEVWAKLDAGTEGYFRKVNRAAASLDGILGNILGAARRRPVVIQTLWMRLDGDAPPPGEVESYCGRLQALLDAGGRLKAIQLHTVARAPAEGYVAPLTGAEMEGVANLVRARLPVPVELFA